jgi:hypothetical protein
MPHHFIHPGWNLHVKIYPYVGSVPRFKEPAENSSLAFLMFLPLTNSCYTIADPLIGYVYVPPVRSFA